MLLNITLTSYVIFVLSVLAVVVLKFKCRVGEDIPFSVSFFADISFICSLLLTACLAIAQIWGLA